MKKLSKLKKVFYNTNIFIYFNISIYLIVLIQEITKVEIRISFTNNFDMKTRNYKR